MLTVVVIAKECVPGRVKTRLTPALSYEQAANVAFASLSDTLEAVNHISATRRILAFDGNPDNAPDEAEGFEVIQQASGGLDTRLASIFDQCTGPTLLVGMDTPQLTAADLNAAARGMQLAAEHDSPASAWLGFANDGGFWALGMTHPDGDHIRGVAMSQHDTGRAQLERLLGAGLEVSLLAELIDVDTFADAVDVAALAPHSRFAHAFESAVRAPEAVTATAMRAVSHTAAHTAARP
ncbi:MAG: glycosyltransferase [Subtercola sp.]|nr:glycosyltransferase [Subtercola sp.]